MFNFFKKFKKQPIFKQKVHFTLPEPKLLALDLVSKYKELEEVVEQHNAVVEHEILLGSRRNTLEKNLMEAFIYYKKYLPISRLSDFNGEYIAEIRFITASGEYFDLNTVFGVKVEKGILEKIEVTEDCFIYDGDTLYVGDKILPEFEVVGFYDVWLLDLEAYERENGFAFDETQSEPIDKDYEIYIEETSMKELLCG